MKRVHTYIGTSVVMLTLLIAPFGAVHAQEYSDQTLHEQSLTVKSSIVDTLQEYVKYMQIKFILRLQDRVTYLQTLVDNQ